MHRSRFSVLLCLGVATTLLLAGCTASSQQPDPGAQAPQSGQTNSPEELRQALQEFSEGRSNARILDDGQLRESIPSAEAWVKGLEVNPAECGLALTAPLGEQLEHAAMAALQLDDAFITLASYADAGQVAESFNAEEQRSERCSRYTVLQGGHHVAFHMARQPLATNAEQSTAHVLTSSDGGAANQQILVKAAAANLMITINQPLNPATQTEQLKELSGEVNRLLDLLD